MNLWLEFVEDPEKIGLMKSMLKKVGKAFTPSTLNPNKPIKSTAA